MSFGLYGRRMIKSDETEVTIENVVAILNKALPYHWENRSEIQYLWYYYRGLQPILNREKQVRPEICNKIVENRANEIVSFKSGYLMGEPLQYNNEKTGKRELFIAQDGAKMNQWGVLQYFEEVQTQTGASAKADALLKLYDQKTRKLTIQNAFGDVRVRAGSAVVVALNLGDIVTNNYMVVNKVTHTFRGDEHMMALDLIGGEFIA